jgi:cytochrome b
MVDSHRIRIWDIWVRLFHWSLVLSVAFLLLSGLTGWQFIDWHRTVGELVLALIVFRLLWGIAGSSNARLHILVRSPKAVLLHLGELCRRSSHPERGHNAAGGWAVVVMLLILTTQAITGFFIADEDELIEGALYGTLSSANTDLAYRIHKINANVIQIVIGVHVLMVLAYLLYARQNLIKPMISGWMNWPASATPAAVVFQKSWVGLLLCLLAAMAVGLLAGWFG